MATHSILSPLPGMFYRRPSPDQPPFKNDGDAVAVGDVIGLIEVMKSFHEVQAGRAPARSSRFLVEDEDAGDGRPAARRGRAA